MSHDRLLPRHRFAKLLVAVFCVFGVLRICAQNTSGDLPQTPASAEQMFSSYEGQNISSIEIAVQPSIDETQFSSLFAQKAGEPFSKDKVNQTATAIRATGKFKDVRIQVDPEATGVRVMFILEPAVYFGVFNFPGAERFPTRA
jgi:outer membrane protein assembly factor BamA